MDWHVEQIAYADVGEDGSLIRAVSSRFVNVTEDVQGNLEAFHPLKQVAATNITAEKGSVVVSPRRRMGDQNVGVCGDAIPFCPKRFAARQVEGHVFEYGLPGTAVKFDPLNRREFIL